jgi:hypothetical protein
MKKDIKIISCTVNGSWYGDSIGETFPLIREKENEYVTTDRNGCMRTIKRHDAVTIKRKEDESNM